jgi:hypothetical protein
MQWGIVFAGGMAAAFWLVSALMRAPNLPLTADMTTIPIARSVRRQSWFSAIAAVFAGIATALQAGQHIYRCDRHRAKDFRVLPWRLCEQRGLAGHRENAEHDPYKRKAA